MRLRTIVWMLVGLFAVIAVVFMLLTRSRDVGPSLDAVHRQAVVVENKLTELENRIAQARLQPPPDQDPARFAPVEQLMVDARSQLAEVRQADKLDEAMARLTQARGNYSQARREFARLTRRPRR